MQRIVMTILLTLALVWSGAATAEDQPQPQPRPVEGAKVTAPEGDYAVAILDFDIPEAPDLFAQWRYVGALRDGSIWIDHGIGISEPGGVLEVADGRLSGTFTRIHGRRNVVERQVEVDAELRDGKIEGTARIGEHEGAITGRLVPEADLRRDNAVPEDKGLPTFLGPARGGVAAEPTGTAMIDSPDQIQLRWRTEQTDIGQGIGSISRFMHGWRDAHGMRTASGSSSPVLADGVLYLSYYVPAPGRSPVTGLGRSPGMASLEQATAQLAEQSGLEEGKLPTHALEKVWEAVDEVVVAMDAATGQTLWKAVVEGRGWNLQHHKAGPFNMTPAVGAGGVFAINMSGNLYAFDAATGEPRWELPLGLGSGVLYSATVQVVDGIVVAPYRNRWAGFDPATGELRWRSDMGVGHATVVSWSGGGRHLLIGGAGDRIVALDAADGEQVWSLPARVRSGGRGLGSGGLAVHGDRLLGYVFTDPQQREQAHAVAWKLGDGRPRELWRVPVEDFHGGVVPVVVRGRYLFAGDLQVIDLESGRVVARGEGTRPGNGGYLQAMEDLVFVRRDGTHGRIETCIYRVAGDGAVTNLTPDRDWSPPFGGGTTSYHHPIMYPMVDGRMFLRQRDGIYCWDLRRPATDERIEQAQQRAEHGEVDRAAEKLTGLLDDERHSVRLQAVDALAGLGDAAAPAAPALADMLTAIAWEPAARRAFDLLEKLGDGIAPALLEATAHPRSTVRQRAWMLLEQVQDKPEALKAKVRRAALDDPDRGVRHAAMDCYASLGAAAVPGLVGWIEADDAEVRKAGFDTLSRLGSDAMDAVPALLPMLELRDEKPDLYESALVTLLHIGPEGPLPQSAKPGLKELMTTRDTGPVHEAADYLHRYGEHMIPFFIECLDQDNHTGHIEYRLILRASHALSLYGADAEKALPALREIANRNWAHRAHFVPGQIREAIERIEEAVQGQRSR